MLTVFSTISGGRPEIPPFLIPYIVDESIHVDPEGFWQGDKQESIAVFWEIICRGIDFDPEEDVYITEAGHRFSVVYREEDEDFFDSMQFIVHRDAPDYKLWNCDGKLKCYSRYNPVSSDKRDSDPDAYVEHSRDYFYDYEEE